MASCPSYVLDYEDVISQPVLLVDPNHPELVGFSALHGGRGVQTAPNDAPPSERSRANSVHQPHTTFRSTDGGASWEDMPYYAPDPLQNKGREVYGEDNAAILDEKGHVVLASLYAYRDSGGPLGPVQPFRFTVGVWKAGPLSRTIDYASDWALLPPAGGSDDAIDSVHAAFVPATGTLVVAWRESVPDSPSASTSDRTSKFVGIAWSRPGGGASWTRLDPHLAGIGPCDVISDLAVFRTDVFVACRSPRDGAWGVDAVDTANWTTRFVSDAPLAGGNALLVPIEPNGHMAIVASGLDANDVPFVHVAYGFAGDSWSMPQDLSRSVSSGAVNLADARVLAADYAPLSGNLHLVYEERSRGGDAGAVAGSFTKTLASVHAYGEFEGKADLGVGQVSRTDFSPVLTGTGDGAFSDLHDGLVVWHDPNGGPPREFLAYGDYGYVRFAEIVEQDFAPPLTPPSTAVLPIPTPTAGILPAIVGLPAGLLASAAVARVMLARQEDATEAKDE